MSTKHTIICNYNEERINNLNVNQETYEMMIYDKENQKFIIRLLDDTEIQIKNENYVITTPGGYIIQLEPDTIIFDNLDDYSSKCFHESCKKRYKGEIKK